MFDSNEMLELAAIKRYRYARDGGGGAHKVYNSSKAYDEARGYREMTPYRRACYEATVLWRIAARSTLEDYRCAIWRDVDGKGMADVTI